MKVDSIQSKEKVYSGNLRKLEFKENDVIARVLKQKPLWSHYTSKIMFIVVEYRTLF